MVVDVVLPAVLGLVHVGETGISACASTRVSDMCAYITKGIYLRSGSSGDGQSSSYSKLRVSSSQSMGNALIKLPGAGRSFVHVEGAPCWTISPAAKTPLLASDALKDQTTFLGEGIFYRGRQAVPVTNLKGLVTSSWPSSSDMMNDSGSATVRAKCGRQLERFEEEGLGSGRFRYASNVGSSRFRIRCSGLKMCASGAIGPMGPLGGRKWAIC